MRTTVDLDSDLLRLARHLSQERDATLGRVLSDLIRQGLAPAPKPAKQHGLIPTLARKPGAQPVTSQIVKDLLESEV